MNLYSQIIGALAVIRSQNKLNHDLKDFNEILSFHLNNIYSHESLLKFKFLGGSPSDEEIKVLSLVELEKIIKQRQNYELQDNISAARKKWIYQSIEPFFQQLCK